MKDKKQITPKQKSFIETVVSNFNETDLQIVEKLGIARNTFYKWRRQFQDEIDKRLREKFAHSKPRIYKALEKKAIEGDVQAIKLALELTGEYVPHSRMDIREKPQCNIVVNLREALHQASESEKVVKVIDGQPTNELIPSDEPI